MDRTEVGRGGLAVSDYSPGVSRPLPAEKKEKNMCLVAFFVKEKKYFLEE